MSFDDILDQAIEMLQRRGRLTYSALKRQFQLDDGYLNDLKDELIYGQQVARDEDERVLVWVGKASAASPSSTPLQEPDREPLAYTPQYLADKILISRSALEGERKQVTVLFCDIANSTPLAERLGAEAMHTFLNRFFEVALQEVHRYEGTVNQFLGDGFMALFGAPIAHEDHARRACYAASGLRERLLNGVFVAPHGAEVSIRIGLNTGQVIVGAIGDNLRMDYTAVGDTTNVASRLQGVAVPGQIVLSETTRRLVEGYCTTEPLGPLSLKGKEEAISAWSLIAVRETRNRLEIEAERGLTPFIGRERELRLLQESFDQVRAGHGQAVFLIGEAGLGKSRLIHEHRQRLGEDATWLEGHALSFGRAFAFHPIIDLLKRNFRIEDDTESTIIEKITQGVLRLGNDLHSVLPYFRYLLAVDSGDADLETMDPLLRRNKIFEALKLLLLRAAEKRLQVLVFEDLHWVDQATEDFLSFLLDSIPTMRVLCLFTYRPGYRNPFGDRSYYVRIPLSTFSERDTIVIARAILATDHLPEELHALIARKAEGNPFFIEEMMKSLQEVGAIRRSGNRYLLTRPLEEIIVPDTIQDVLLARIDRLEETTKRTLQTAAVIGREFSYRLLDHLATMRRQTASYLQELKAIELIYEKSRLPELIYMFKHALTQDVAYHSLLEQRRQELHRLIAEAIEELYVDRLSEQYEMLAYHYNEGMEWEKALKYMVMAGDKSVAAYANQQGLDYYARAWELCEQLGKTALSTAVSVGAKRANLHFTIGNFPGAVTDFERMRVAAQQLGDRHQEGMALAYRGMAELWDHDFDQAERTLRKALEIAEEGFDDVQWMASYWLGFTLVVVNRHQESAFHLQVAENLLPTIDNLVCRAMWAVLGSHVPVWKGDYNKALSVFERWRGAAEASKQVFLIVHTRWSEALAHGAIGNYQIALDLMEDVIALAERAGENPYRARAYNTIGWLYRELEDHQKSIEYNRRGIEEAELIKSRSKIEVEANARINLGDSLFVLAQLDEAEEQFQHVERIVREPKPEDRWMLWRYAQHLFHSYGELCLARGQFNKALNYADECLMLAEESESKKNIVKAQRLRGQTFIVQGDLISADQALSAALEVATQIGNPPQLWKTLSAIGDLRRKQGRLEESNKAYQDAFAVIETVASELEKEDLREKFLTAKHIQEIQSAAKTSYN